MGRRYYCDYCDKYFTYTREAVRKHNAGVYHQKFRNEHYALYEDKRTTYEREIRKNPCKRFLDSGQCPFGINCRFTHFNKYQLDALKWEIDQEDRVQTSLPIIAAQHPESNFTFGDWLMERTRRNMPNSWPLRDAFAKEWMKSSSEGTLKIHPWRYPEILYHIGDLPPSLRPLTASNFDRSNTRQT